MSPIYPTEKKFEDHIEHHLKQSSYDSVDSTLYDKDLCLIPNKILDFIKSDLNYTIKEAKIFNRWQQLAGIIKG